jgi:hypothetical protein
MKCGRLEPCLATARSSCPIFGSLRSRLSASAAGGTGAIAWRRERKLKWEAAAASEIAKDHVEWAVVQRLRLMQPAAMARASPE